MRPVNADEVEAWIRRYRPVEESNTRLICFPHAGGSATFFHPLAMALPDNVDVVALQYPGRQDRRHEPLVGSVEEYADRITAALSTLPPKPTVYFGHSMGAVLAFETVLRLEHRSAAVIVASGRRGPSTHRDDHVHLGDDQQILAEVKRLNGTSGALLADDEIVRMSMPAIRGDYTVIETYTCPRGRQVDTPISVLIGTDDPQSTVPEAHAWRQHTTGGFRLRTFPGGHFYLIAHQQAVTVELSEELDGVGGRRHATRVQG
jgi:surfactin synthase thioesterase subunit